MGPQRTSALLVSDTSSFSELELRRPQPDRAATTASSPDVLVEGSFARAYNKIAETPSVDSWRVTDYDRGAERHHRRHRRSTSRATGHELPVPRQGDDHRSAATQIKRGFLYEDVEYSQVNQRTGPDVHRADGQRRHGRVDQDPSRRQRSAGSPRDARELQRRSATRRSITAASSRRTPGGRRSADGQPRRPLRRADAGRARSSPLIALEGTPSTSSAQGQLGAAHRRWSTTCWATAGRASSATRAASSRESRTTSPRARSRSTRGLTRGDYFDAGLTRPIPNGTSQHADARPPPAPTTSTSSGGRRRRPDRPEREAVLQGRVRRWLRVGGAAEHNARHALHPPQDRPRARGRGGRTGGGLRLRPSLALQQRGLHPHEPGPEHPGRYPEPAPASRIRCTSTTRSSSRWTGASATTGCCWQSYRWSRLHGTFEGFFREDNGQSDPGITSLYDFPTNDPNYTTIGVPQFGYQGDIRYPGRARAGPLPLDRPHPVKMLGN